MVFVISSLLNNDQKAGEIEDKIEYLCVLNLIKHLFQILRSLCITKPNFPAHRARGGEDMLSL